jgi:hypothetical protein
MFANNLRGGGGGSNGGGGGGGIGDIGQCMDVEGVWG